MLTADATHRIDLLKAKVIRGEPLTLEEEREALDAMRDSRLAASRGRTAARKAAAAPDGSALLDTILTDQ